MKLLYKIVLRLSIVILVILSLWAFLFYNALIKEINDETDDALELYSQDIIIRFLASEDIPEKENGTNNSYYLEKLPSGYSSRKIEYFDETIYVESKDETEPARVIKTDFQTPDCQYYRLTVKTPTIEKQDLQRSILLWTIIVYALLLISIILVNIRVINSMLKPLYRLLKWLDDSQLGTTIKPLVNKTDVVEYQKLNNAAVSYVRRSEAMYNQQKLFIGNASHEMQTPIAVCQNRLEMLLDMDLNEEQTGEIIKIQNTLSHLSKLNKSLLLLAGIENGQYRKREVIPFKDLITKQLQDINDVYSSMYITVKVNLEQHPSWEMDESLSLILINNIIKNAFIHNRKGGRIIIESTNSSIIISNTGLTDEPLDTNRVFTRFYQGFKKEGSTGLGLSITKAICDLYGIKIQYYYFEGLHNFSLKK